MNKIITFGEIMMRLKPPGFNRLMQSPTFEATFAGGEANVAVSLSNFGLPVSFVTVLPKNDLAEACIKQLRSFGVDTGSIVRSGSRMGIYFLEAGSNQRPSKVIYDRAHSSIADAPESILDWEQILQGADWFHTTGITPAISQSAANMTLTAVQTAKRLGVPVSCDLNYRKNLWKYGKQAAEVMGEIVQSVDTVIANEEDFQMSLGFDAGPHDVEKGEIDPDTYLRIAKTAMARYPNIKRVAITLRQSFSADRNRWQACLYDGHAFCLSKGYDLTDIVDRVGGGDSFGAGLIYGLHTYDSPQEALEFAVAASCLKHTINGDYNRVSISEVENLMKGSGSGRVQR